MPTYERKRVGIKNFGKKFCDKCKLKLEEDTTLGYSRRFAWIKDNDSSIIMCDNCYNLEVSQCEKCKKYFDTQEELDIHKKTVPAKHVYRNKPCSTWDPMGHRPPEGCSRCGEELQDGVWWEYGFKAYGWVSHGNSYHYGDTLCDNCYNKLGDSKGILEPSKHIYQNLECNFWESCDRCYVSLVVDWESETDPYGWVTFEDNYHYGSTLCDNCYNRLGDNEVLVELENE